MNATNHSTNQRQWQEVPSSEFAARSSADTCRWELPLPKALALTRGYLKSDPLVLALLRLRPLASLRCHSAR